MDFAANTFNNKERVYSRAIAFSPLRCSDGLWEGVRCSIERG